MGIPANRMGRRLPATPRRSNFYDCIRVRDQQADTTVQEWRKVVFLKRSIFQGPRRAAGRRAGGDGCRRRRGLPPENPDENHPSGSRLHEHAAGLSGYKIGSPGRTRTCDQSVTSFPAFLPGSDYLITRLTNQVRVSGACEVLLDWVPQPLVSARSCLPKTLRQASLRIPFPSSPRTRGRLP